jgi:hypothetical protein
MRLALLIAVLAMLATFAASAGKQRQARLMLGFTMLVVVLGTGCLGGNKNPPSIPGTPAGSYTLTILGTSGTGLNALAHIVKVTLVVN